MRPSCIYCGKPVESKGRSFSGKKIWNKVCSTCRAKLKKNFPVSVLMMERKKCYQCGFVAINPCQLDVDHIDGNSKNTKIENFQIICANCHRLKTFLNKDWKQFNKKIDKQLKLF